MSDSLSYTKQIICIGARSDFPSVLQSLRTLQNQVIVNVADSAEGPPVLFSEENLRSILASTPDVLFVETVPLDDYLGLVEERIGQSIQTALSLRAALRANYADELVPQIHRFSARLNQVAQMLGCYALHYSRTGAAAVLHELGEALEQLAVSCGKKSDNVLCMDGLHHQILPALERLRAALREHSV